MADNDFTRDTDAQDLTTGATPDTPGSGQGQQTQESDADLLDGPPGHPSDDDTCTPPVSEQPAWPSTTTREFLQTLWGEIPDGKVLIWMLPDKKSRWYAHFENIDDDMRFHENEDVYTGVGIAPKEGLRLPSNKRLKEWEVAGIAGLWADIDIAHGVHKKAEMLPPSIEQALEVLNELPFQATMVANSGHGLQLWWVFKEVWLFADEDERESARRVCQWWHKMLKELFAVHNWTVDSTFDLARVMRLPGTWNNKEPEDRKPVEVVGGTKERYDRANFLELVPGDFEATPMGVRVTRNADGNGYEFVPGSSGLTMDPDAEPSSTRMETLLKLEPRFSATWDKNRPDLADQSPSAYDMALANFAVRAEWPDQEVCNLLIAFRRRHRLELKLREDYYARTIGKAHLDAPTMPPKNQGHSQLGSPASEQVQSEAADEGYDPMGLRSTVVLVQDEGVNVKACVAAVTASNDPPNFFSVPDARGICVLAGKEVRVCTPTESHLEIANRGKFLKWDKKGKLQNATPTVTLMKLVHVALRRALPTFNGVKRLPFLWNGKLFGQPGYHPESGYFVDVPEDIDLTLSVADGLEVIEEYLGEFPYETAADKANAFSTIIGAPLKVLGNAPGLYVDKPASQTGASLLCTCLAWIIDGRHPAIVTQGTSTGELDKRVITKLKDNPAAIIIDNITGVLDSVMLVSGMTDHYFGGRLLNVNDDAVVETKNLALMFTGNNFLASRDLLNRCLRCRLDANHPMPETRSGFRHVLPAAVRKNRSTLVSAVASIVQRWIEAGMPKGNPILGAFPDYTQALSGLMTFAGMSDLDGNRARMVRAVVPPAENLEPIVCQWWEAHNSAPVSAKDLLPLAEDLAITGKDERGLAASLSQKLAKAIGQVFEIADGVRVKIEDSGRDANGRAKRGLKYRLRKL